MKIVIKFRILAIAPPSLAPNSLPLSPLSLSSLFRERSSSSSLSTCVCVSCWFCDKIAISSTRHSPK